MSNLMPIPSMGNDRVDVRILWLPAEDLTRFIATTDQGSWIAGASGAEFDRDVFSSYLFSSIDDFLDRKAIAITEIENLTDLIL